VSPDLLLHCLHAVWHRFRHHPHGRSCSRSGNYPIVSFEHTDAIPSIVSVDPEGEVHFGRSEAGWTVLRSFKRLLDEGHPEAEVRIGNRSFTPADLLTRFLAHVREQLFHHSNAGLRKKDKIEAAVSVPRMRPPRSG